jgi:Na+/proline symporter
VNALDYAVLVGTIVGIAVYGIWYTRHARNLSAYLKGSGNSRWLGIGISVMATQASAITFMSTPGQGYQDGLGFVQNYFGAPFALIIIAIVFLPLYRQLGVHTVYEFLGQRFDSKTRLLGAGLFLLQRGIGAGITIYAPAIVLSTAMGWSLNVTIVCSSTLVIAYTVAGGTDAVSVTQKYQMAVITLGMVVAFVLLVAGLPQDLRFGDAMSLAGGFQKLKAVNFSVDLNERYTFWSGLFGGMFLALSYFGADQSQVQRYIGGASLRDSRLGLMFNGIFKIPMQFGILLLGALLFVFYQFHSAPVFFNTVAWSEHARGPAGQELRDLERQFGDVQSLKQEELTAWLRARRSGDPAAAERAFARARVAHSEGEVLRTRTRAILHEASSRLSTNDADYVFITFVLNQLPHGVIGLLLAVFFAAALQSKAAELNALASTTIIDLYKHLLRDDATDDHHVVASKVFTVMWGLIAMAFALFASMSDNLIQAVNIVGSIFYGVALGLVLVAFFCKSVGGTAVFWAGLVAQALVFALFATLDISYLWYNVIGCMACLAFSLMLQPLVGRTTAR